MSPPTQQAASSPLFDPERLASAPENVDGLRSVLRDLLKEIRAELVRRFDEGAGVKGLVRLHAKAVDGLLLHVWKRFIGVGAGSRPALIAVGGYGRCELHPASDIDILILIEGLATDKEGGEFSRFLTFLWDIGLEVGHSVRTVDECAEAAEREITVATNLMETRLLTGPRRLYQAMRVATGKDAVWPSEKFLRAKWDEQIERHNKYDNTAYNLEPNVKEGPGGLRDIQTIAWVFKRHFRSDKLGLLVSDGILTKKEYATWLEGRDYLWRVRFALHTLAGHGEERLLFDYQRRLAERFGFKDTEQRLAVEQFMKEYFHTVVELHRMNEMLLELFQEAIVMVDQKAEIVPLNSRFQARNGYLEVTSEDLFQRNRFALLELFLTLQEHPELKGVRATTTRLIMANLHLINDSFREDIRSRSLFLELFKRPTGLTHGLWRMNNYGVLAAYMPAFEAVVGLMQFDLFHTYTVDAHILFVVQNLRCFTVPERQHEFPFCSEIIQRIPKPELLYLAGLFHDIAKGRGGDHSELGAEDARRFCLEMGLGEWDADLVAWLVRNHLIMSVTAQRRDISDPDVIHLFASEVGDTNRLDYLYLLTVADIRATGPKLWNSWKDALLKNLYHAAKRALRRGLENPIGRQERLDEIRQAARQILGEDSYLDPQIGALWEILSEDYFLSHTPGEVARHTRSIAGHSADRQPLVLVQASTHRGGTEVLIYTRDRRQLFATTTAVLDQLQLSIMEARIMTIGNGLVLDTFSVLEEDGEPVSGTGREEEIRRRLIERLSGEQSPPKLVSRHVSRRLRCFKFPTRVSLSRDEAGRRTIIEVTASDRPGLLSRLALAMAAQRVRLHRAKIATYGERVEDIFFLTDEEGLPLNEELAQGFKREVLKALDEA